MQQQDDIQSLLNESQELFDDRVHTELAIELLSTSDPRDNSPGISVVEQMLALYRRSRTILIVHGPCLESWKFNTCLEKSRV